MAAVDNSLMTAKGVTMLKYRSSKFDEIDIVLNVDDDGYIVSYSSCRRNIMTLRMVLMSQMKRK